MRHSIRFTQAWHPRSITSTLLLALLLAASTGLATLTGCTGSSTTPAPAPTNTPSSPVSFAATTFAPGLVGTPYTKTIAAANGTAPFQFTLVAGTMPAGTSISFQGVVSGTPLAPGTSTFTLQVTDSSSPQGTSQQQFTWLVEAPLALTAGALPGGVSGVAYTSPLAASGGLAPYTYTITAGTLPAGLTLSTAGVISGTPTAVSASTFTVQVVDSSASVMKATAVYTLAIAPTPVVLGTAALPAGLQGLPYTAAVTASGGTPPYTFTAGNALPTGLTLASTGAITGIPTANGTTTFSVTAKDSSATPQSVTASYTIAVTTPPFTVTAVTLPPALVSTAYSQPITVVGGTSPYTYAVTTGSLPAGLTLTGNTLSGTPTTVASTTFVVTVTDSSKTPQTTQASYPFNVVNATVAVNAAAPLATIPQTGFGIHTSIYAAAVADAANVGPLLKTDGVTVMRYPGGIYADYFHWAQNTLTPVNASTAPACGPNVGGVQTPGTAANGYQAQNTDFGHFVKTLQAAGAQALITVNYGASLGDSTGTRKTGSYGPNTCSEPLTGGQPQEAAAWVAYANGSATNTQAIGIDAAGFNWQTVGFWAALRGASPLAVDDGFNFLRIAQPAPIGIKYWEVGNELFYNGYISQNSELDLHAPYIYQNGYPTATSPAGYTFASRLGVSALSPTSYGTNTAAFIAAMKAVDSTINIGLVVSSPNVDPIPTSWNASALQAVCTTSAFDFLVIHYYPGTYNAVTGQQLLTLPQTAIPALIAGYRSQLATSCPAFAGKVQYFITETGSNGRYVANTPVQTDGLYAGHIYLTAMENGIQNVDWLELQNGNPGTYLSNTEAPEPAYYGIELAHLVAGIGDQLVTTTATTGSGIDAHATLKTSGQKGVLLINSSTSTASTVAVTITGAPVGATANVYSYGINTTQTGPTLAPTSITLQGSTFVVTVPAFTMMSIIVQ